MSAGSVKAGSGYLELFLKSDSLMAGLKAVEGKLTSFSSAMAGIGAGFAAAGAAIATPLLAMAHGAAETGDAIRDMSLRTGVSTEALSQLGFAAEQSGTDMATVEKSISKMQRVIASPAASKALGSLGLSLDEIKNMSPDKQFEMIGDAISKIQDPAQRTAAMMAIFGKSGTQLAPMFENGAQGIRDMREEADALGRTIGSEDADAADNFNDSLNALMSTVKSMQFAIGSALLPALTDLMNVAIDIIKPIVAFVKENKQLAVVALYAAGVLVGIGAAFAALSAFGFMLAGVVSGVIAAITALGTLITFILSPFGLVVAAVAAATAAFFSFTETGRGLIDLVISKFGAMLDYVQKVWQGISDALMSGNWALAGQIAMTALEGAILVGLQAISKLIGGTFGALVGTIGTKLLRGDLMGAWNSVVLAMGSVFSSFVSGVIGMFTSMTRAMIQTWSSAVESIANKILDMASEGGIFGAAFEAVTGVNMAEERARSERLNAEARRRGLATTDIGAVASQSVSDSVNAWTAGITTAMDRADQWAQGAVETSAAALEADTSDGMSAMDDAARENQDQLNALIAQAAAERDAMKKKQEEQVSAVSAMPGLQTAAELASIGTFSGAAAASIGMAAPGANVQERMAETLDDIRDLQEENNTLLAESGGEFGP